MFKNSFRLERLEIFNHKFLGDKKIEFFNEHNDSDFPFTTLIIGPNGTGKSEILKIIIQIFREIEFKKLGNKLYTPFKYSIHYHLNGNSYEVNKKESYKTEFLKNGKLLISLI